MGMPLVCIDKHLLGPQLFHNRQIGAVPLKSKQARTLKDSLLSLG